MIFDKLTNKNIKFGLHKSFADLNYTYPLRFQSTPLHSSKQHRGFTTQLYIDPRLIDHPGSFSSTCRCSDISVSH